MDATYITPFVHSVQSVLLTMLNIDVRFGEPTLKAQPVPFDGITGTIGMTGDVQGCVAVNFPGSTGTRLASLFLNEEVGEESDDFADAIGELVNMFCGNAKMKFVDRSVSITCPSVIRGTCDYQVRNNKVATIVIPCDTDCGPFTVEVTLRDTAQVESPTQDAA